jgi:hypothetical protein
MLSHDPCQAVLHNYHSGLGHYSSWRDVQRRASSLQITVLRIQKAVSLMSN